MTAPNIGPVPVDYSSVDTAMQQLSSGKKKTNSGMDEYEAIVDLEIGGQKKQVKVTINVKANENIEKVKELAQDLLISAIKYRLGTKTESIHLRETPKGLVMQRKFTQPHVEGQYFKDKIQAQPRKAKNYIKEGVAVSRIDGDYKAKLQDIKDRMKARKVTLPTSAGLDPSAVAKIKPAIKQPTKPPTIEPPQHKPVRPASFIEGDSSSEEEEEGLIPLEDDSNFAEQLREMNEVDSDDDLSQGYESEAKTKPKVAGLFGKVMGKVKGIFKPTHKRIISKDTDEAIPLKPSPPSISASIVLTEPIDEV